MRKITKQQKSQTAAKNHNQKRPHSSWHIHKQSYPE